MPDTIIILNCHSVLVCFQEFIVQDNCPLAVVHFPMAMHHKGGIRSLPANKKALKVSGSYHSTGLRICIAYSLRAFMHCLQIGDVDRKVLTFGPSTHFLLQDKQAIV
jgi:hypothetical protein